MQNVSLKSDYRPEIDGVRALAVISVIINHFNKALLPSGYLGVDIFFVISGYVISSSLYKNSGKSFADFILGFYARRVKRIVPALAVCVLLTSVLICLFDSTPKASLRTGIASLFGASNLYLLKQAADYFGGSAQLNAFTHTWSLGVEEQFYLFLPLLFWMTGFGRGREHYWNRLCGALDLLAVCSLALFVQMSIMHPSAAFYLMPTRFWELGLGCLLFVILSRGRYPATLLATKVRSLPVLIFLAAILFIPSAYSIYSTIGVVTLTALLIASTQPGTVGYAILAHPTAVYVGRISYSLYLWHWSVLVLSRWTIGVHAWSAPLIAGLMLFLAAASYRYVESPMRRAEWSPLRWRSIFYGFAASASIAGVLLILAGPLDGRIYTGKPAKLVAEGTRSLTDRYDLPATSSSWQGDVCVLSDNNEVGKIIPINGCTLGDFSNARRKILVLGNSFSAAFVQGFDQLVTSDKYSVTITASWGASPVADIPNNGPWDRANNYYWSEVVPSLVSQLRVGDWVFLVSDLAVFSPEQTSASSERNLNQLKKGLAKFADRLSERGIRLAVLDGIPFGRDAGCVPEAAARQWFAPFGGPCQFFSKQQILVRGARLAQILSTLSSQGKLTLVNVMDVFCPTQMCTYFASNGQLLYRDVWSHPSVEAVRLSAPLIRAAFILNDRPGSAFRSNRSTGEPTTVPHS